MRCLQQAGSMNYLLAIDCAQVFPASSSAMAFSDLTQMNLQIPVTDGHRAWVGTRRRPPSATLPQQY